MRVVVIGLGSMGKRRVRLIQQINDTIEITGVDSKPERCREAAERFGINTCGSLEELHELDCAFVCTSPLSHAKIINYCLDRGWHVFTELNLVADMYEENMALAEEKGLTLFLSSPFLYRKEVHYIDERIKECGCKVNYTYHVGQYLPDWHPWESYKSFFVGDKRSSACRELMAVELPWLAKIFGAIKSFFVLSDKASSLEIDYPDNYLISFEHESGAKGLLAIDIISRKAVRNFELFGEELYITWDGSPQGLFEYDLTEREDRRVSLYSSVDRLDCYSGNIIENSYLEEIKTFFDAINMKAKPDYTFQDDRYVLDLIAQIQKN